MKNYIALICFFFLIPVSAYADWNELKWGTKPSDALVILKNKATGMTNISGIEPITRIKPNKTSASSFEQVSAKSITAIYQNSSGNFDVYLLFDDDDLLDEIILYSDNIPACITQKNTLIQAYGAPIGVSETKSPWLEVDGKKINEKDSIIYFSNSSNNIMYKFYSGEPNPLMRKCTIVITKTEILG